MTGTASLQRLCDAAACTGHHDPQERVALAGRLCAERGVRLTSIRRRVLELLWSRGEPLGAYEIIEAWQRATGRSVGPPTVYRALEFLIAQGLVAKLESRSAFVPCAHPERRHICVFFICKHCGSSAELESTLIERELSGSADSLGFRIGRRIVEVEGACARCANFANVT
jgi:Fur family transcriptional regulator, zinc uptake regulator